MQNHDLKFYIEKAVACIDEDLEQDNIPIYERYIKAANIFVKYFVKETSFGSNEEFLKSDIFFECIVPIVNDWYYAKYGELAKDPRTYIFKAIITIRQQPILIKFPATTSTIEKEGETVWLNFLDHLDNSEDIQSMIEGRNIQLEHLSSSQQTKVRQQIQEVVSFIRTISINLTFLKVDRKTANLAATIISELEKSAIDITSYDLSRISSSCWNTHLAIEKTMKVYLKQKLGFFKEIHDLKNLFSSIIECDEKISETISNDLINSFPKNVVALRYGEETIPIEKAISFYKNALRLITVISSSFDRDFKINNAAILLKKAPWAK